MREDWIISSSLAFNQEARPLSPWGKGYENGFHNGERSKDKEWVSRVQKRIDELRKECLPYLTIKNAIPVAKIDVLKELLSEAKSSEGGEELVK